MDLEHKILDNNLLEGVSPLQFRHAMRRDLADLPPRSVHSPALMLLKSTRECRVVEGDLGWWSRCGPPRGSSGVRNSKPRAFQRSAPAHYCSAYHDSSTQHTTHCHWAEKEQQTSKSKARGWHGVGEKGAVTLLHARHNPCPTSPSPAPRPPRSSRASCRSREGAAEACAAFCFFF